MATAVKVNKLTFVWEGKNAKGQTLRGEMEGQNPDLVKAQLRRQNIVPLRVRKKAKPLFSSRSKVTPYDIAIMSRQLATMMSAGVPLVQAFDIIGQGNENKAVRELVMTIKTDIEAGGTLASALARHPQYFDDLFVSLVSAGEQSGTLENLLDKIAIYKEKTEALKGKIKKAMFYPVAVIVVAFVVTAVLLIFVIPEFKKLFESMGSGLPAFTQFVVDLSEAFQAWWWAIFGGIAGSVFLFSYAKSKSKAFADWLDAALLKLPVVGNIINKAAIARFSRTLSTMSTAGVPLVEAMEAVAGTAGNAVFYRAIMRMRDEASTGQQLQVSMRQTGMFPNMVVQMVAIGEESGSIDTMLGKVADFYEEEVDNAVDGLTSLMEPFIMAFLGIVVGGLVVAMYLPIFNMADTF